MRYARIFLLHLQQALEQRSVMIVYFLMSLVSPFLLILFWQGAASGGRSIVPGWDFSAIVSYYFYFTIVSGLLMAHIESDVAYDHIKQGDLARYLLKPIPYFLQMLFFEFSWRVVRVCYGIITIIMFYIFLKNQLIGINSNMGELVLVLIVLSLGFMISFIIKMIMGITAFWLVDTHGFFELIDVILMVFAGYVLPLALLPSGISTLATMLPFAYIIYFPVIVLEGKVPLEGILHIIAIQLVWIGLLAVLYGFIWRRGLQKFTAVGH